MIDGKKYSGIIGHFRPSKISIFSVNFGEIWAESSGPAHAHPSEVEKNNDRKIPVSIGSFRKNFFCSKNDLKFALYFFKNREIDFFPESVGGPKSLKKDAFFGPGPGFFPFFQSRQNNFGRYRYHDFDAQKLSKNDLKLALYFF